MRTVGCGLFVRRLAVFLDFGFAQSCKSVVHHMLGLACVIRVGSSQPLPFLFGYRYLVRSKVYPTGLQLSPNGLTGRVC